jgi:hypothetical protein
MTMCQDCEKAASVEWWQFSANCMGCRARAAARSPQFFDAKKTGSQPRPYRALLQQFALTHEQVRTAAKEDAFMRSRP